MSLAILDAKDARDEALRLVSLLGPEQTSEWKDYAYDLIVTALNAARSTTGGSA